MPIDHSTLVLLGRLLLGGAFVFAGLRNIANRATLTGLMTARGVPAGPGSRSISASPGRSCGAFC